MKKAILLGLFVASACTFSANAQDLKLGVKAGFNVATLKTDKSIFDNNNSVGFLAGIWGRIGGNQFHIQPEAYFTSKSATIHPDADNAGSDFVKGDLKFTNIDVPILLGTKFPVGPIKLKLQAGPLFSFVVDENNSYKDNVTGTINEGLKNYKDKFSSLVVGTGIDFSKLIVDLRYEYGLGNISRNETAGKQTLNLWTISVGYSLF
ncbi:porin family protein [Sphingobacterium litopenaei]|uniref:PorT family protein n=1 Tax=Sphingobacterium litopenaei TaxID=2763500 RepID=A0ABR7Y9K6_9SPHI|nr:porin family protein [Sphingobacterium litopenaei]MBD1427988.1 PorT family protein [Sphingobacterium litopenaei]